MRKPKPVAPFGTCGRRNVSPSPVCGGTVPSHPLDADPSSGRSLSCNGNGIEPGRVSNTPAGITVSDHCAGSEDASTAGRAHVAVASANPSTSYTPARLGAYNTQ